MENNTKIDLTVKGYEVASYVKVAKDRIQWCALSLMALNHRVVPKYTKVFTYTFLHFLTVLTRIFVSLMLQVVH